MSDPKKQEKVNKQKEDKKKKSDKPELVPSFFMFVYSHTFAVRGRQKD